MREILFRGKRADNGEWVIGYYVQKKDPLLVGVAYHYILTQEKDNCGCLMSTVSWYKVIPETVGQYTGLTDKNGKKIFDGDICKHRSNYSGEYVISVVAYTDGQFLAMADNNSGFNLSDNLEVIGNIHDNPELLKGGVQE